MSLCILKLKADQSSSWYKLTIAYSSIGVHTHNDGSVKMHTINNVDCLSVNLTC